LSIVFKTRFGGKKKPGWTGKRNIILNAKTEVTENESLDTDETKIWEDGQSQIVSIFSTKLRKKKRGGLVGARKGGRSASNTGPR